MGHERTGRHVGALRRLRVMLRRHSVAPGEDERLAEAGVGLFGDGERTWFRQPCPHSSCGRCQIYQERFEICRSFECSLLRTVSRGQLSVSEGKERVVTARALLDKVAAYDDALRTVAGRNAVRKRLSEQAGTGPKSAPRAASERLLSIVAVETYLSRWFRLKRDDDDVMS